MKKLIDSSHPVENGSSVARDKVVPGGAGVSHHNGGEFGGDRAIIDEVSRAQEGYRRAPPHVQHTAAYFLPTEEIKTLVSKVLARNPQHCPGVLLKNRATKTLRVDG